MSFLDLYQGEQQEQARYIKQASHPDLPATFSDTFGADWDRGRLFGNSNAHENARMGALQDYIDDVRSKTGVNIGERMDWIDSAPGVGPFPNPSSALLDQANGAVGKLKEKNDKFDIAPLEDDELDQRAVAKSRQALQDAALIDQREKTFGGKVGSLLGGIASASTDPVNILALPLAPETESVGILGAALRWAGVAGVAQFGSEVAGMGYHEQVQPGYLESGAPIANIAEAAAGGAVLGGGTRALGNLWTRVKTGSWPTSVKDAGNLVESEANVANSNPLKGVEGEVAHRGALTEAIDATVAGRPVEVSHIITPEIEARSRSIIDRLNAETPLTLPIVDQDALRLTTEEAGLRARDAELASHIEQLPEGNPVSADRLNRLNAVDEQIAAATDAKQKRALAERRDQILVDTSPERLKAEAAPLEALRIANAERNSITSRLDEIAAERAQKRIENPSTPAMIGQRMPVRARELFEADHDFPTPEPPPAVNADALHATVNSPEFENGLRADIDRERMIQDRQIPVDVDGNGEPIYRSLDSMADEVDAYKTAADHIAACASGQPENPNG